MHNCKITRKNLIDLLLNENTAAKSTQVVAELNACEACEAEYAALRSTLHVSNQALRSTLPAEDFWPGYHSRLQTKLFASEKQRMEEATSIGLLDRVWFAVKTILTTSLRVPLPAALGLILMFGAAVFLVRAHSQVNVGSSTPIALVETRTIEVPVPQEKIVTRVVYVARKTDRSSRGVNGSEKEYPQTLTGSDPAAQTAMSLAGFKPTDAVKLTVIKGSDKDQRR
jgi:anti-sigma factor RsiW